MSIINSLIRLLKKENQQATDVPEGLCPNCWGREEYGGQFYETAKNNNMDVNSTSPNIGWVQEYANKHLSGIQLVNQDNKILCQKCKLTYKPSP